MFELCIHVVQLFESALMDLKIPPSFEFIAVVWTTVPLNFDQSFLLYVCMTVFNAVDDF